MPPRSEAQRRLFRWAAAHPKQAAKEGISRSVAKEFNDTDPGGKLPKRVKTRAKKG